MTPNKNRRGNCVFGFRCQRLARLSVAVVAVAVAVPVNTRPLVVGDARTRSLVVVKTLQNLKLQNRPVGEVRLIL